MDKSDEADELCCCEYAREGDGETRNLLQCLCECEDLDSLADDCLQWVCCEGEGTSRRPVAGTHREKLRRVLLTVEDRVRIPWFGGAKKFNAGLVAAPLVLQLLSVLCTACTWAPWVLLCLCLTAAHLISLQVLCLSLPWRTDYFVSWLAFSVAGIYWDYARFVLPEQGWAAACVMHTLLLAVVAAFLTAVLQRPRRRRVEELHQLEGWPLTAGRCYRCRVCEHAVWRRDHHCVWINQCVGAHNHRAFLAFVLGFATLALSYAVQASTRLQLVGLLREAQLPPRLAGAAYAAIGGGLALALGVAQVKGISQGLTAHERQRLARAGRAGNSSAKGLRQHPFDRGSCLANWMVWWRAGGKEAKRALLDDDYDDDAEHL